MSPDERQPTANPFVIPDVPKTAVMDQFRELNDIHMKQYRQIIELYKDLADHLKKLLKDSGLKFWIVAAGLGAIVEVVRIGWLVLTYVFPSLRR